MISDHYDIGELLWADRNRRGYINTSYDIDTLKDGQIGQYIFRIYREGRQENKIRYEHALINELQTREFQLSPRPVATNDGETFTKVYDELEGASQHTYISILSFLPGEDKYSWKDPLCTHKELEKAAEVLARYHSTIFGWEGISSWDEPRIVDLLPLMLEQWREYAQRASNTNFEIYFQEEFDYLLKILENPGYIISRGIYKELPQLAIHGDYHPGNLKFQNGDIVGLFDFDWSRMDARCFDVGLAIVYFCTSWESDTDGDLLLERVALFLDAYQKVAAEMEPLGPFSKLELECLPQMILAGNLYVLNWIIQEFYATRDDSKGYLRYLQHSVRTVRWLERNWNALKELVIRRSQG
jgi:homoserine kinase type II